MSSILIFVSFKTKIQLIKWSKLRKLGDCGEQFGPKVWHSNSQYRRVIWQCNHKFKGEVKCTTPHLTEDALKEYTRQALSFLIENREALIEDGRLVFTFTNGSEETVMM